MILPNHKSSYMILISSMSFFVLLEALKILCRIIHVSNAWIRWKLFHPKRKQLSKLNKFWKKSVVKKLLRYSKVVSGHLRIPVKKCWIDTLASRAKTGNENLSSLTTLEKSFYNLVFEMSSSFITYEGLKCGWH